MSDGKWVDVNVSAFVDFYINNNKIYYVHDRIIIQQI